MNAIAYTLAYNEERMIRFWLAHYSRFASKLVVYDNYSTDNTVEIVRSYPNTEIRKYDTNNKVIDMAMLKIKNECYKEARGKADYVIVGDVDELLYHEDMTGFLERCLQDGVTLPSVAGFEMVGTHVPETGLLTDHITNGAVCMLETKQIVFSPRLDMNFSVGAHACSPLGSVKQSSDHAKLLHYKFVSLPYVLENYRRLGSRLSADNLRRGLGVHYLASKEEIEKKYADLMQSAKPVVKGVYN